MAMAQSTRASLVGQSYLARHADDRRMWHWRIVCGQLASSASKYVILTPDHDLYIEDTR